MGVDTTGIIKKRTSPKKILEFIKETYDSESVYRKTSTPYFHIIEFNDGEDGRILYIFQHGKDHENIDDISLENGKVFNKKSFTYLNFGCWGNSADIIEKIIKNFGGGYIDKNDCDCIGYEEINNE